MDHSLSLAPSYTSPLNMYNYDTVASLKQQEPFRKASDPHHWSMTPNPPAQAFPSGMGMASAGNQIIMPRHPQNERMIRRIGEAPASEVPEYTRGELDAWAEQPMRYVQRDNDPRHWQFYPGTNRWSRPP